MSITLHRHKLIRLKGRYQRESMYGLINRNFNRWHYYSMLKIAKTWVKLWNGYVMNFTSLNIAFWSPCITNQDIIFLKRPLSAYFMLIQKYDHIVIISMFFRRQYYKFVKWSPFWVVKLNRFKFSTYSYIIHR